MGLLTAFFSQGWINALIGIIGIGATITGLYLYKASRIGPKPAYQLDSLRLIGKKKSALPEEVEIRFGDKSVSQLTKTHVVLWNSGNATLYGKNIIEDDPLRFEFSESTEILQVRVVRETRKSNKFVANISSNSPNQVICSFDYLDARDGVFIELLHTAEELYPEVRGTIRGVPQGLSNYGYIDPYRSQMQPLLLKNIIKIMMLILFLLGVFMTGYAFLSLPDRWVFVINGLIVISFPLVWLWAIRRGFPKSLKIEDIEGMLRDYS